ncbi:zinc-ribbon domain-containing protein [Candidatus Pelagibacter sp.]|nr:zinc-ribbon domain-containing protein [Candidatus Pelagibacter sp.]
MIIICPCGEKKFEVNENLIPDKGRLLKCGSCDQTWFFNKNVSEQTEPIIDKPAKQKKILYKDENINKSESKAPIKPGSELVKYKPKYNFTFGKFLSYIIVSIITFIAIIIVLDTFKDPLSDIFPNLELVLYNLFETLRDLILFAKDLN